MYGISVQQIESWCRGTTWSASAVDGPNRDIVVLFRHELYDPTTMCKAEELPSADAAKGTIGNNSSSSVPTLTSISQKLENRSPVMCIGESDNLKEESQRHKERLYCNYMIRKCEQDLKEMDDSRAELEVEINELKLARQRSKSRSTN